MNLLEKMKETSILVIPIMFLVLVSYPTVAPVWWFLIPGYGFELAMTFFVHRFFRKRRSC